MSGQESQNKIAGITKDGEIKTPPLLPRKMRKEESLLNEELVRLSNRFVNFLRTKPSEEQIIYRYHVLDRAWIKFCHKPWKYMKPIPSAFEKSIAANVQSLPALIKSSINLKTATANGDQQNSGETQE